MSGLALITIVPVGRFLNDLPGAIPSEESAAKT